MKAHLKSYDENMTEGAEKESASAKKAPGAFLTISEVADELDVPQHVLRFWETKFTQIKPLKRGGGRRYYRPEDVSLLKVVHKLLYTDKYTIKGVQNLLKGQSKMQILQGSYGQQDGAEKAPVVVASNSNDGHAIPAERRDALKAVLADLKTLRDMIDA